MATVAQASWPVTSVCPFDGEEAYFQTFKTLASGDVCKFAHTHSDGSGKRIRHEYWERCSDE